MLFREQKSLFVKAGRFVGLENFMAVFQHPLVDRFVPALLRTLLFVGTNYIMVWVFGMTFALLMYELSDRVRRRFFILVFLPYLLSGFGVGMIISMLFAGETGSLTLLFKALGLGTGHLDIYSPSIHALIPLFEGWRFAGFNMALFLGGLLAIPPETIDSSKVDGASYFQRLRHIYLPQMIPTLILVTVMCMMGSFGIFEVPIGLNALQGNTQVMFMAVLIYSQGFQAGSMTSSAANLGHVVATSVLVYLPLLVLAFVLRRIQQRTQYE
jgi:multiple sugar transport system permease protein